MLELKGLSHKRKVAWHLPENRNCLHLANFGFSINTIADATGLTPGQICYRLNRRELKVGDYRKGKSPGAMIVFKKYKVVPHEAKRNSRAVALSN
jgi:hypothetical protein